MSTVNFSDTTPAAPANSANVHFQSDASGNISAYSPVGGWTTWTPSITDGSGASVGGVSLFWQQYQCVGRTVYFIFSASFTLASPTTLIKVTLPLNATGNGMPVYGNAAATASQNTLNAVCFINWAPTRVDCYLAGSVNWPAGTVTQLSIAGFYPF